jgi:glycerophosphoryl diester phosphodiesterase
MVIALALASLMHPELKPARLPRVRHKFIVVAHRGDHVTLPENTLASVGQAIKDEADYAEIDLQSTKDGQIVLMHDGQVDRTTEFHGRIRDFTFEQMTAMRTRQTQPDASGQRPLTDYKVPSLDDMFKLAKGKINLYLDIKSVTPEQVKPYLEKYRMKGHVIAYVYSTRQFEDWKRVLPDVPVITDGNVRDEASAESWWRSCPCEIVDGSFRNHTPAEIAVYHRLGAVVWPDIQNPLESPTQWDVALAAGVDGLQTDHPAQLVAYLKEKKRR